MELEHWLWVGVSFGVSLLLVWLVWNFCCGDRLRGAKGEDGDKSEDSDSFSSTHVITRSHPRKVRRKRRHSKRRHDSSTVETTTDDESSGGEGSEGRRPRRKSRKGRVTPTSDKNLNSSSYSYKQNNYGLHDPFSEWAPKVTKYRDPTLPIVHNYPKSPSVPRRQLDTTVNLAT